MCFFCNGAVSCNEAERRALLNFKADLEDPSSRLSSWAGSNGDCCTWSGVTCDNITGHVTHLHLECLYCLEKSKFKGKINPSLLDLKRLTYLDLSDNNFQGIPIPGFLGSMLSLNSLLLDSSGFGGSIPHQLGNLSNLQQLSLKATTDYLLYADTLQWLSGLPSLEYLDLSNVDLRNASNWLIMINTIPRLSELYLSNCHIRHNPPLPKVNLTFLSVLDLGLNYFRGPIPDEIQNLTSLVSLSMPTNNFNASLPNWLFNFPHLQHLDFAGSELVGKVPNGIENLTSLVYLELSMNENLELEGGIPSSFKHLCNLNTLSMSSVKVNANISQVLEILGECPSRTLEVLRLNGCQLFGQLVDGIGKFKRLSHLTLSDNSISGLIPMSIGEMESLSYMNLAGNQINGTIPTSFGKLANLEWADISMNSMEGVVYPEIHFANLQNLSCFSASGNKMVMKVGQDWVPPKLLYILNLNSWQIGPHFPKWIRQILYLQSLDLSNAGITEPIPEWFFWERHFQYGYLNLSHNRIPGKLPSYLSALTSDSLFDFNAQFLNLGANLLSGEIPNCWKNWPKLKVLRLASNNFTGKIPTSIGTLSSLRSLRIENNSLTGEIPSSLVNCSSLLSIDLGDNSLEGNIPKWIAEQGLSNLHIINLRGNKFKGSIPEELCHLQLLQILDLSHNSLSGNLPDCIGNFSAMSSSKTHAKGEIFVFYGRKQLFVEYLFLVTKGQVNGYSTILNYVRSLDLSWNNFSGEIPGQITRLATLQYLNLSHNSFSGVIPKDIAAMGSLESLDLSWNQMCQEIPTGLGSLTFLNHLNLSYNNFSGKIPSSTQLQSLDSSSFVGNKQLCGRPLNERCETKDVVPGFGKGNEDSGLSWFSGNIVIGFVAGLWAVIIPVAVNPRWRLFYFGFLDYMGIKLWTCLTSWS
ncbi:Receptor-like protein EIX2 [Linum grandiflorum]